MFFQWYQINKPVETLVIRIMWGHKPQHMSHLWTHLFKITVSDTVIKCVMEVNIFPTLGDKLLFLFIKGHGSLSIKIDQLLHQLLHCLE